MVAVILQEFEKGFLSYASRSILATFPSAAILVLSETSLVGLESAKWITFLLAVNPSRLNGVN